MAAANINTACTLAFHGAAANSCPHSLLWVRAPGGSCGASGDNDAGGDGASQSDGLVDTVIYASSGVVSLATSYDCLSNNVASVDRTLVTRTLDNASEAGAKKVLARGEAAEDARAPRSVTALAWVDGTQNGNSNSFGMVAAFSDGTVTSWRHKDNEWREHVLVGHDPSSDTSCARYREDVDASNLQESIADVTACNIDETAGSAWMVATASSKGIFIHISHVSEEGESAHSRQVGHHAAASVLLQPRTDEDGMGECYLFAGSASPRHNKVWVYSVRYSSNDAMDTSSTSWASLPKLTVEEPHCHGHLLGHQDWVTCFSWLGHFANNENGGDRKESLLASSGHDAKIRLWKFSSRVSSARDGDGPELDEEGSTSGEDSDNDEANIDDLDEEEGEARLVISHTSSWTTTAVSLEALLLGHEEGVTSLTWRKPTKNSNERPCLLSSSMDRTILLWMEEAHSDEGDAAAGVGGGVWVPISRVGSAGGILGGSIGASLMGFVDAAFSPDAKRIVGHGYGGSVHFWTQERAQPDPAMDIEKDDDGMGGEDAMMTARWIADPCITGHFRSVEDMAWDPNGEYLLTTSSDQTTRLWTDVPTSKKHRRWVEVGRPQVHGYDMTSIVCIGGQGDNSGNGEPRHRFASGADEKVLRVFDAPASTLRTLQSIRRSRQSTPSKVEGDTEDQPASWRVERAFMPSLGLSNKATADTEQESSKYSGPVDDDEFEESLDTVKGEAVELKLPSERDLGVTTLWPETRKLFGHESELVCLDAHRAPPGGPTLVASSCKARNDVASAAIRLWDANKGTCVGVLKGGHRSTVSTMSFSRDGRYLASSGKDRRICIWKRVRESSADGQDGGSPYELCAAADSAHKRIVWSVHFCPGRPDILASGSRDGSIKVWRVSDASDGSLEMKEMHRFEPKAGKSPVTAVAFAEHVLSGDGGAEYGMLSVGTEAGAVEVWTIPFPATDSADGDSSASPALLHAVSADNCHFGAVKKVSWRPGSTLTDGVRELTLASCGVDGSVRIFTLTVKAGR